MAKKGSNAKKYFLLVLLIIAGSAVYELAYVRYNYYDVMMEALQLNNTQMGVLMSAYGIGATICYFPGGWLADRVSCKKLLVFSLVATGLVGFWFASFPSYGICLLIHLLWAITNTLTFYAAMMKATRMLGDSSEQGRMFGILEGGRGLVPLTYSFAILAVFNSLGATVGSFRVVILCYSGISLAAGLLMLFFFRETKIQEEETEGSLLQDIVTVVKMPAVWLIAMIIFCSYIMYVGQSYITPYLTEMFGASVSTSAFISLIRTYFIAIFAGPIAGICADKIGSSVKIVSYAFIGVVIAAILFLLIPAAPNFLWPVVLAMVLMAFAVFVTRGIYFAAIDEVKVPMRYTGAAVGLASFLGYLPEAFMYTLIGNWMDRYPGVTGYKIMFGFMMVMGVAGVLVCLVLYRKIKALNQAAA